MSALRLFMQGIKRSEQAIWSLLRRGPSDRIRTCGCAAQAPAQPGGNLKRDAAGSTSPLKIKNMRHQWHLIFFGPSDRIRTCGILLPKQARYQLRYTRLSSDRAHSIPSPGTGFA